MKKILSLAFLLAAASLFFPEVYAGGRANTKPRVKPQVAAQASRCDFSKLPEDILLAKMIYGEARSCSYQEMLRVGFTAVNRANDGKKWNGTTVKGAILSPKQYSCFNINDPNRKLLEQNLSGEVYDKCLQAARDVLSGRYVDLTESTHYHTPAVNPAWARKMTQTGREKGHIFYREK